MESGGPKRKRPAEAGRRAGDAIPGGATRAQAAPPVPLQAQSQPTAGRVIVYPAKSVVVAFPPNRHSGQLQNFAHGSFTIGEANLRQSQLADPVI